MQAHAASSRLRLRVRKLTSDRRPRSPAFVARACAIIPASTGAIAIEFSIVIIVLASVAGLTWLVLSRRSAAEVQHGGREATTPGAAHASLQRTSPIEFSNDAIDAAFKESFAILFGVPSNDEQIAGEHAKVLHRIGSAIEESLDHTEHFPRRPMVLPRLMQALNDPDVSRETLVKLILEDPAIAGGVLRQANSAYYRVSPARVDSIDRAVWLLGTEGLRRLMATAILQPVFRLPRGHFDSFAPITWEQAQRAAAAAEAYAKHVVPCDAFVAQLLAGLEPLARIVIFRISLDQYRETPDTPPRAEVFIRAMQVHGPRVASKIGAAWEMSATSLAALDEQAQQRSPSHMQELGRALYFARLTSALAVLAARKPESQEDEYVDLLAGQGLDKTQARMLWVAAVSACGPS